MISLIKKSLITLIIIIPSELIAGNITATINNNEIQPWHGDNTEIKIHLKQDYGSPPIELIITASCQNKKGVITGQGEKRFRLTLSEESTVVNVKTNIKECIRATPSVRSVYEQQPRPHAGPELR